MKLKNKKGVTLVEAMVSTVLLGLIGVISTQVFLSNQRTYSTIEMSNTLKSNGQIGFNNIGRDIATAKVFISRNPNEPINSTTSYSSYYLSRLKMNGNLLTNYITLGNDSCSAITTSALPQAIDTLSFSPDNVTNFNANAVGNSLMLGSYEDTYTYSWSATYIDYTAIPSVTKTMTKYRTLDILQLKYYYLANMRGSELSNMLALIKATSSYYIDYTQLLKLLGELNSTQQTDLINKLKLNIVSDSKTNIKLEAAWNYSEKRNIATGVDRFYQFNYSSGALSPVTSSYVIPISKLDYVLRDNVIIGTKYGISKNITASEAPNPNLAVPKFANPSTGFPNGFEVMMSGSAGARSIFMRGVGVGNIPSKKAYVEITALAQGKDS